MYNGVNMEKKITVKEWVTNITKRVTHFIFANKRQANNFAKENVEPDYDTACKELRGSGEGENLTEKLLASRREDLDLE